MKILLWIFIPLGLLILRIFHRSHTDQEGLPERDCEAKVYTAETLIAVLLVLGFVELLGAPLWGALGIVGLGLYLRELKIDMQLRLRRLVSNREGESMKTEGGPRQSSLGCSSL